MAGDSFGKLFKISNWGESHGKGIGVVVEGCPAGLKLNEEDIQPYLDKRRPGQSSITTRRDEADAVEILSGTVDGITTGTPLTLFIRNKDQKSKDYSEMAKLYRPSHADYTYQKKYGIRDVAGGGRSSARVTAGHVAAGAVAQGGEDGAPALHAQLVLSEIARCEGGRVQAEELGKCLCLSKREALVG